MGAVPPGDSVPTVTKINNGQSCNSNSDYYGRSLDARTDKDQLSDPFGCVGLRSAGRSIFFCLDCRCRNYTVVLLTECSFSDPSEWVTWLLIDVNGKAVYRNSVLPSSISSFCQCDSPLSLLHAVSLIKTVII